MFLNVISNKSCKLEEWEAMKTVPGVEDWWRLGATDTCQGVPCAETAGGKGLGQKVVDAARGQADASVFRWPEPLQLDWSDQGQSLEWAERGPRRVT